MPSVTLTFSAEHATRIQAALDIARPEVDEEGNLVPADVAKFKEYLIGEVAKFVRNVERQKARDDADAGVNWVEVS